jgi:hypothetical protein
MNHGRYLVAGLTIGVCSTCAFIALGVGMLIGCPPASSADAAPPPPPSAGISFEQGICNELAAGGCSWGRSPGCASAIASSRLDDAGNYLTAWGACIYINKSVAGCAVPCGDP